MKQFIQRLPKAELHIHVEGSLEPEMLLRLANRNKIVLPYKNQADIIAAYNFNNLQSFLDLYYQGIQVLQTEEDFYELMYAYLQKSASQNVTKAEIFFDPQAHTVRGISWSIFMSGFIRALNEARLQLNIDGKLILCFLRHLPEYDAMKTLEHALLYRDSFIGVGLDSSEIGFPPHLFKNVFRLAKEAKLYLVAHAGEEGPAEYIWSAIDILGVDRIDHGNNAIQDMELVRRIAIDKIPLTMCPLSNQRLKLVPNLKSHQLRNFMDAGVIVTINSDDPSYFGGYINENYLVMAEALKLNEIELRMLSQNSLNACFN